MVMPSEVNSLVNFITVTKLSLVDTYTGVILPNIITAVSILLLKPAYRGSTAGFDRCGARRWLK